MSANPFRLDGRRVLVTGATGHLGEAMCRSLGRMGAHVLVNHYGRDKAEDLAERLGREGFSAEASVFDCSEPGSIDQAAPALGALDGIICNAYSGRVGPIEAIEPEDFEKALRFNLSGPFRLVRACLPGMKVSRAAGERGGPSVVLVASMYGMLSPDPRIYGDSGANNPVHYGATKAGVIQMARYLAVHLAPVRVNSISPGPFPPPTIRDANPAFHESLCAKNPLGRIGAAEECADAAAFLISPASSYVTGINLPVDGGWTAW